MSAEWTIMVYMAGNNSLSGAAAQDLRELQQVGSTDAVKALAFVKQRAPRSAYYRAIGKGRYETVVELGDVDSGHPQTVVDFVRWGIAAAPAKRYALVLWNHGGGWTPDDMEELYTQVRRANGNARAEVNLRAKQRLGRAVFSKTVKTILKLPDIRQRKICSDDTSSHSLDTIEVQNILKAVKQDTGQDLDLFGMDACLMSTIEVAYQVRELARVVVGSEELEPAAGWPYHQILADLNAKPSMDAEELGKAIVARYLESYRTKPRQWPVTQSAVRTAKVGPFTTALDGLAAALRRQVATDPLPVIQAHLRSCRFEGELVDLQSFGKQLLARTPSSGVSAAVTAMNDALKPGGYVIAEGHLGDAVQDCAGVSLYLPSPSDTISRYYRDLDFAKHHTWDEMLRAYHRAL